MFHELPSDGQSDGRKRERPSRDRPLVDREVPLGPPSTTIATAVHAWLDGDTPERDARHGEGSRDVEFWKRLDDDLASRRRMRTPICLQARIMEAIPQPPPVRIPPWYRREFVLTPSGALIAAAALMAGTAAITSLLLRLYLHCRIASPKPARSSRLLFFASFLCTGACVLP